MDPRRLERLTEALREELGELISFELSDPRVTSVTLTEVIVSPDGKKAQIRVAVPGDDAEQREAIAALNGARGFLKHELASRVELFRIPELHFEAALSADLNPRLEHLLKRIRRGRPRD